MGKERQEERKIATQEGRGRKNDRKREEREEERWKEGNTEKRAKLS